MDLARSSPPARIRRSPWAILEHRLAGRVAAAAALTVLLSAVFALLPPPGTSAHTGAVDSDAALAAAALAGEFSALGATALQREASPDAVRAASAAQARR